MSALTRLGLVAGLMLMTLGTSGCSMQKGGGGSLQTGMSTDQAVEAMGQPDLKDSLPDPNHSGATMLRYTWLNAGEAAVFGPDMRVANILNIGSSPTSLADVQQERIKPAFDPLETPLDYAFYPFRAAVTYIFAGLNCLGGGGCRSPQLPPVVPSVVPG